MDKNRGLVLGVVAVLVVGAGSASVLDSFGSISGTAEVEPAIEFVEVKATSNPEYVLVENVADVPIDVSRIELTSESDDEVETLESLNATNELAPNRYMIIVTENVNIDSYSGSKEFVKATTNDGGITSSLADSGENLQLMIDGSKINNLNYDVDCEDNDPKEVKCGDGKFEVSNK